MDRPYERLHGQPTWHRGAVLVKGRIMISLHVTLEFFAVQITRLKRIIISY